MDKRVERVSGLGDKKNEKNKDMVMFVWNADSVIKIKVTVLLSNFILFSCIERFPLHFNLFRIALWVVFFVHLNTIQWIVE